MSPTILRSEGYRFFFYAREHAGGTLEAAHVHVTKGGAEAKVWIDSGDVAATYGFSPAEMRAIRRLVEANRSLLRKAWDEFFREPPRPSARADR